MNFYIQNLEEVDRFAQSRGHIDKWKSYSLEDRRRLIFFASNDIEILHGQPRQNFDLPWKFGDTWLKEACLNQVLFLARNKNMREFIERAQMGSIRSYSDGIISLVDPGGRKFDPIAEQLTNDMLNRSGKETGFPEFERG
jgi:hypothetical protein